MYGVRYLDAVLELICGRAQVSEELRALGVAEEAIQGVLAAVAITDVSQLEELLGADNEVQHPPSPLTSTSHCK